MSKKIMVKIDGKWLNVYGYFVETKKEHIHATRFPEDIQDIKLLDESEEEVEDIIKKVAKKVYDDHREVFEMLGNKPKQKIEKLQMLVDDNWTIVSNDGRLYGDDDKTRDQVLMMKINEIIDLLNKKG